MEKNEAESYFKGRGSQIRTDNKFLKYRYVSEHIEGLDEPLVQLPQTKVYQEHSKSIVNKIESPDLGMMYSLNPYQGCEHGCSYCYARNTHEYYGLDAGLDFESKIIVKANASQLLEKLFHKASWKPVPISVSGNTDCYQPLERKMELTRSLLKVFARYRHPVGMITKNSLILRDKDLLQDLAQDKLVKVFISITSLDENVRRRMEPRTASASKRLKTIEELSIAGIPVGVMCAPIIPGLTDHETPAILKAAADHGALTAGMTVVRLNGSVGPIFEDWIHKNFPDRAHKVIDQICSMHGQLNDSQFGRRMRGEGKVAEMINLLFTTSKRKYFSGRSFPEYDLTKFRRGGNLNLF
ncbi:PA0069 family radical SAM protein [Algoriphagus sp. D3-2-R+10]|uniref:PA0069 family radical SAM protein n=1 Tax=Algoriphagus aurantiacus TaxID=3103948 RepID=UPI002B3F236D|nr:PA0069 family radical SAM protein [Algoriphagus sp. D3-2-R+10]MEB2777698.1 PA0069 family radical SAM protein [Algoriphagus sp. D3-2-R+10]